MRDMKLLRFSPWLLCDPARVLVTSFEHFVEYLVGSRLDEGLGEVRCGQQDRKHHRTWDRALPLREGKIYSFFKTLRAR